MAISTISSSGINQADDTVLCTTSGNVGIGTSSPAAKLDVTATIRALSSTASAPASGKGVETWYDSSGDFGRIASYDRTGGAYKNQYIDGLALYLNSQSGGNVGIGTSSPAQKLDVQAADYVAIRAFSDNSDVDTRLQSYSTNGTGYVGTISNHPFFVCTNNTERMRIDTSGIVTGTAGNLMLVQGTPVNSTSGTSISFTSIPSWAKRITLSFSGMSLSGSALYYVQLGTGAGTYATSGYVGCAGRIATSGAVASATLSAGFTVPFGDATQTASGLLTFANVSGNTWSGSGAAGAQNFACYVGGSIALGAALTCIRVFTSNGTDTFDAGVVNIQYE